MGVVEDGMPAEHDVAEQIPAEMPRRRHDPSHAKQRAQFLGMAGGRGTGADHLLEGDDIGVNGANDVGDARRIRAAVEAPAPMDVVGGDAQLSPAGV